MITLIGTGHVFDLKQQLLEIIDNKKPEVICVELDEERYEMLIVKRLNPKVYNTYKEQLPILPKLFLYHQEKIAKADNVNQGDEMLTAVNYAKSHNIKFEFIDRNQNEIYLKTINSIPFSEKFLLCILGIFYITISFLYTYNKIKKILMKKNITDYDKLILKYGKKFPTLKKIWLDERNEYMANKLIQIVKEYENIVACIGDLHISGVSKILESNNIKHEIIRLKNLLE
jgi:pheromone shutdown protein TraB